MAAAYAYYLVGNHPFLDGNKRAGLFTALYFLQLNGIEVAAPQSVMEPATLRLANRTMSIDGFAALLKKHVLKIR